MESEGPAPPTLTSAAKPKRPRTRAKPGAEVRQILQRAEEVIARYDLLNTKTTLSADAADEQQQHLQHLQHLQQQQRPSTAASSGSAADESTTRERVDALVDECTSAGRQRDRMLTELDGQTRLLQTSSSAEAIRRERERESDATDDDDDEQQREEAELLRDAAALGAELSTRMREQVSAARESHGRQVSGLREQARTWFDKAAGIEAASGAASARDQHAAARAAADFAVLLDDFRQLEAETLRMKGALSRKGGSSSGGAGGRREVSRSEERV